MNKRSILSIVVIILIAGSWYLLRHFTSFASKDNKYYGYYEDVKGLQASSGIYDKGVKVGKVTAVELEGSRVKVSFAIRKTEPVPVGTAAIITPGDLLGGKAIRLETGKGPGLIKPGSFLKTGSDTSFTENFDSKITPVLEDGKFMLRTVDTGLTGFNTLLIGGWGHRTQSDIQKMLQTTNSLAKAAVSANGKTTTITNGIVKLDSMTKDPTSRNASMDKAISSYETKTNKLVKSDMGKQLEDIRSSINKFSANIKHIREETKGPGKLLNDRTDYDKANTSLDTMNRSMQELQNDPPGLSIFGGRKKRNQGIRNISLSVNQVLN